MDRRQGSDLRPGGAAAGLLAWTGANIVPLVLIPIAAVFIWVAIWQIWLPRPGGGATSNRTVTTVDASAGSRPTHKVTTVVKTAAQPSPSRRSETLVIMLLFLGVGAAVIAVFHDRIGSIELDKDGVKITLTKPERDGAAELVDRLARSGASPRKLARGLRRYINTVAVQRPPARSLMLAEADTGATGPGLTTEQASALAQRIADDLL